MTPDRDETLLRQALQEGLHPAETDLWPAVAEALPAGEKRQKRRTRALRLAVCIGAPLLLAAGALLGRVQFTNLRTNPRPSFAPENNTGYAIQYDQTAYQLPDKLMDSVMAHYNGRTDADGVPPMETYLSGRDLPPSGPGGHGYSSWADLTEATGLPLLQNDLLDNATPMDAIRWSSALPEPAPAGSEDWTEQDFIIYYNRLHLSQAMPAGFTIVWNTTSDSQMAPDILSARRKDKLDNGYTIETVSRTLLATIDRPAGSTTTQHQVYFARSSGYTWDVEEYTTPAGIVMLIPVCTSNTAPYLDHYAYFEQDGIYYTVCIYPDDGWGPNNRDKAEAARAVLKEVLDSFTPAA